MPGGAKGKYSKWLVPSQLELVTNWVANGCVDKALAERMGIACSTLYDWKNRFSEFSEAIEKGRELQPESMENTFYCRARGGVTVTETIEEFRGEMRDGKPWNGTIVKRTVKKELPPDPASLMFYLKNKKGYRSEPRDDAPKQDEAAPTFTYRRA